MTYTPARKNTIKILEMMDDGTVDPKYIAEMCLRWISEQGVTEMIEANELFFNEEENEDD